MLHVYTRRGCHLCEQLIEALVPLTRGRLETEFRDVDKRPEWRRKYGTRIPVIEYDGELVCQYHLDRDALAKILVKLPT